MMHVSKAIGQLDTIRRLHGPNTELGWACSNAIEQLKSLSKETNPAAITALKQFTDASLKDISRRLRGNAESENYRRSQAEQRSRQAGEG